MTIPTEPIGSIPRPAELLAAMRAHAAGELSDEQLKTAEESALRDTIARFEETGSPIITDGEQTKPSFATYPLAGLKNVDAGGVTIPFADGHTRQLPKLTGGPFRYAVKAVSYLSAAKRYTKRPVKQAVISASALSLLYPQDGVGGYSRDDFLKDLLNEAEQDIRQCLEAGAACVQIDFTEGRLALKLDPSGELLKSFVGSQQPRTAKILAGRADEHWSPYLPGRRSRSTHSADVDYAQLLPALFRLKAGRFYIQLASEPDRKRLLDAIAKLLKRGQTIFVGVTDPINARVETPEEVRDRVIEAAKVIPIESLGTTDDCGFSPFADDTSTSRETAFYKIKSRVEGTLMASRSLGV